MVVIASEAAHDLFTYTTLDYSFAHWLKGQYDILCYLLSHGISTPFGDEILIMPANGNHHPVDVRYRMRFLTQVSQVF